MFIINCPKYFTLRIDSKRTNKYVQYTFSPKNLFSTISIRPIPWLPPISFNFKKMSRGLIYFFPFSSVKRMGIPFSKVISSLKYEIEFKQFIIYNIRLLLTLYRQQETVLDLYSSKTNLGEVLD